MIPLLLLLAGILLLPGIINKTRALCAGRTGYRFFQPLWNVGVLLRKGSVYSTSATWISRTGPSFYLGTLLVAMLFIPLGGFSAWISFEGDFILFCYLLVLGKLALLFTALESGSAFQGMGSARETLFSMLIEPCFFLLMGTFALITGHYSFSSIFAAFDNTSINLIVLSVVAGYTFFNLTLIENGRLPIDDTRTHLELTMIHEAMVLDVSGVDLAWVQIGGWIKGAIYALLTANALVPAQGSEQQWVVVLWHAVVVGLVGVAIGLLESFMTRNRMPKNTTYLATITAIGLLGFLVAFLLAANVMGD